MEINEYLKQLAKKYNAIQRQGNSKEVDFIIRESKNELSDIKNGKCVNYMRKLKIEIAYKKEKKS